MREKVSSITLLAGILSILVLRGTAAQSATIYVPDNFATIQGAVDAANPGDNIIVRDGTYTENIDVNKDHLTIRSENGADVTIVQAAIAGDHVFEVKSDYLDISGFTIKKATGTWSAGIYLDSASYCEISNNKLWDNGYGIATRTYWPAENNIITHNICENNDRGIFISYSSGSNSIIQNECRQNNVGIFVAGGNNTLTSNTVENNTRGLLLYYSNGNNTLTNNIMLGNTYNFNVQGFDLYQYIHNIDSTNTVDGKPIYYLVGEENKQILVDAGYVAIVNSTNITVNSITLSNNQEGVLLAYSTNSTVQNVNVMHNFYGIRLHRSSNNKIVNNEVTNNDRGIFLYYASAGIPSSTDNW